MIGKLKTYLAAGAAFLAMFFYALYKGQIAKAASDKADRATRTAKLQSRITDAFVEGGKKYREKTSQRVKPGRFT